MTHTTFQYTIVDAFTTIPFHGNPAAVIVFDEADSGEVGAPTMQLLAREFNLSETAFIWPTSDATIFELRWFTPAHEIKLCGHATLASAHVVFSRLAKANGTPTTITFRTHLGAGDLHVSLLEETGGKLSMSFPTAVLQEADGVLLDKARRVVAAAVSSEAASAEGFVKRVCIGSSAPYQDYILIQLADEVDLERLDVKGSSFRELAPYAVTTLTNLPPARLRAVSSGNIDFVSRTFGPLFGVDEDPVCGSAHCMLAPYWATRLPSKRSAGEILRTKQVSSRGGDLEVEWREVDGVVELRGNAVVVATGEIVCPRM